MLIEGLWIVIINLIGLTDVMLFREEKTSFNYKEYLGYIEVLLI
jgi:hypothetical protein